MEKLKIKICKNSEACKILSLHSSKQCILQKEILKNCIQKIDKTRCSCAKKRNVGQQLKKVSKTNSFLSSKIRVYSQRSYWLYRESFLSLKKPEGFFHLLSHSTLYLFQYKQFISFYLSCNYLLNCCTEYACGRFLNFRLKKINKKNNFMFQDPFGLFFFKSQQVNLKSLM